MYKIVSIACLMVSIAGCRAPSTDAPVEHRTASQISLQEPPDTPEIFGEGLVSTELFERDMAFLPDARTLYFTIWTGRFGVIVYTTETDDGWTPPQTAPFSGRYSDMEPFVTDDGQRLFFASNRPLTGTGEAKDYDIWYVDKTAAGWGAPQHIDTPVNTARNEFYPTVSSDGTLYITGRYDGGHGGEDIYKFPSTNGSYNAPENLGPAINSSKDEFNSLIAPDERFIIFSSFGREDGAGGGDLYISYRHEGKWQAAQNMGDVFNSPSLDYCPALSPDGRILFFTSRRTTLTVNPEIPYNYQDITGRMRKSQNGNGDIYWVESRSLSPFDVSDK